MKSAATFILCLVLSALRSLSQETTGAEEGPRAGAIGAISEGGGLTNPAVLLGPGAAGVGVIGAEQTYGGGGDGGGRAWPGNGHVGGFGPRGHPVRAVPSMAVTTGYLAQVWGGISGVVENSGTGAGLGLKTNPLDPFADRLEQFDKTIAGLRGRLGELDVGQRADAQRVIGELQSECARVQSSLARATARRDQITPSDLEDLGRQFAGLDTAVSNAERDIPVTRSIAVANLNRNGLLINQQIQLLEAQAQTSPEAAVATRPIIGQLHHLDQLTQERRQAIEGLTGEQFTRMRPAVSEWLAVMDRELSRVQQSVSRIGTEALGGAFESRASTNRP